MQWEFLINETALESVLPTDYVHFARPISEGLAVFLAGLPEDWQQQILSEQAALPLTATSSERLALLARSCPSLHKLGQILARDRRLGPDLRSRLQELESLPPTVPLQTIHETVHRELGSLSRLGITLEPPALAEASVAVVIPYREVGGDKEMSRSGVLKILKPGIEERLERELELFARVGSYLDERCEDLGIPLLDYQETFEQVQEKLRHEVRLDLEQRNLTSAHSLYKSELNIQIPKLLEFCTPRITAMERIYGEKVTAVTANEPVQKRWLANLIVEALIAQPIFARAKEALFHADPHAGNLFFTTDKRLAILDWSLAGSLGERERIAMTQIVLAALTFNQQKILTILEELDQQQRIDRAALAAVVAAWTQQIRQGKFPGFDWLMGMLDHAVQTARLRVAGDMMLFRKSLQTLEGVVADVAGGDRSIDPILLKEFFLSFVQEWPFRWAAWPHSRDFATRLSNTDLTQLLLNLPAAAAQMYWEGLRHLQCSSLCSHSSSRIG